MRRLLTGGLVVLVVGAAFVSSRPAGSSRGFATLALSRVRPFHTGQVLRSVRGPGWWFRCRRRCTPERHWGRFYGIRMVDVGFRLRVRGRGFLSGLTPVVSAFPVLVRRPRILGVPREGTVLTGNPGKWKGVRRFAFLWQDCWQGSCFDIPGARGRTYVLGASDVGRFVRLVVTAYG